MGLFFKKQQQENLYPQVEPCPPIFEIFPEKERIWEICLNVRNRSNKEIFDDIHAQKMNWIKTPDTLWAPNPDSIRTCIILDTVAQILHEHGKPLTFQNSCIILENALSIQNGHYETDILRSRQVRTNHLNFSDNGWDSRGTASNIDLYHVSANQ